VVEPAPTKKIFRTAVVGKVNSLDPSQISNIAEQTLVSNLVDTLFQRNIASGEIIPRACEKYEVSPDGLKWKFFLRRDLFWSTGQRIKAKDYEVAFRRLLKPKTRAPISKKLLNIQGAQEMLEGAFYNPENIGVSSADRMSQSELEITLTKPDPMILQTLSHPSTAPIPADVFENRQEEIFNVDQYMGSGPFVVSQKSSTSYSLQKNRHHRFFSAIQIDEVQFFTLTSASEGEKMFLSGLLDQFGYPDLSLNEQTIAQLAGTGFVIFQPDLRTVFLRLNVNHLPLNQFQLRQAIAMSVNHQRLIESIGVSGEKRTESMMPEGVKFYDAPHGYYSNQAAGKEILTNLGYCEKGECTLMPKITLLYPDTLPMKKIALQFATQFKQSLSTNQIHLKSMEVSTFLNAVEKDDYTLALDELAIGSNEVFGFLHAFVSGNSLSGGYSNPQYDQLISKALSSIHSVDMKKYYREAESLLLRDVVVIPLLTKTTPILLHKRVKGFVPNIWNDHPYETLSIK
jgi:oligopeptide transport system substrate-binding protein